MKGSTPFNKLLSERIKRMMAAQRLKHEEVCHDAGIAAFTLRRMIGGQNASFQNVLSVLYALDASPSDVEAIYADFAECKRGDLSVSIGDER